MGQPFHRLWRIISIFSAKRPQVCRVHNFVACGRQTLCGLLAAHPLSLRRGYPAPPRHQAIRRCGVLPRPLRKTLCNCVGADSSAHLSLSNIRNCVGRSDLIPSISQKTPRALHGGPGVSFSYREYLTSPKFSFSPQIRCRLRTKALQHPAA